MCIRDKSCLPQRRRGERRRLLLAAGHLPTDVACPITGGRKGRPYAGWVLPPRGEDILDEYASLSPLAAQRLHHDRLDEGFAVLAAGVVGADLRALVGVESTLEQLS